MTKTNQDRVPGVGAVWPSNPRPPEDTPNVVIVLLDDVGFAHLGCYGSDISTPNMDALASQGALFNNFHTTALCSPTRASLLTGRNHHAVGMGMVSGFSNGHPGYLGEISHSAATIAEMLGEQGFATIALGKWHLAPLIHNGPSGPYDQWPLGRGFEQYYGFLGPSDDQFTPQLVSGNDHLDREFPDDYHVSEDLVDEGIRRLNDLHAADPNRPFLVYLAFGAAHAPLQAPAEYIERYRGRFDEGWDAARERVHQRQLELGVIPEGTGLAPRNPGVEAWDDLSRDGQRLYARMQEVLAGFLEHTDAQIGRLVDHLKETGEFENTVFVLLSDNGASQEGGPTGRSELHFVEDLPVSIEDMLPHLDELGGRDHHAHYPFGWSQVGNTPLKRWKQNTHGGGIRDPLIVTWPGRVAAEGTIRSQYHHVTDVVPTLLEILGLEAPITYRGVEQMPVHGESFLYALEDPAAPGRKRSQYYEMQGHRAMWQDGWKAVAFHPRGEPFDDDEWELYDTARDFAELENLADVHPDRLADLVDQWWKEAEANDVLPLDDRVKGRRLQELYLWRRDYPRSVTMRSGVRIPSLLAPGAPLLPSSISVDIERDDVGQQGVLVSLGGRMGGYTLYVSDNRLHFEYAYYLRPGTTLTSDDQLPPGSLTCGVRLDMQDRRATATLLVDGEPVASSVTFPVIPMVHVATEPFEVGQDSMSPVSPAYTSPFRFDGTIVQAQLAVPDAWPTAELEAVEWDNTLRHE